MLVEQNWEWVKTRKVEPCVKHGGRDGRMVEHFLTTHFTLIMIVLFSNIEYKENYSTKRERIKNDNAMHPGSTCRRVSVCPNGRVTQAWVWNDVLPMVERSRRNPTESWSKSNIWRRVTR